MFNPSLMRLTRLANICSITAIKITSHQTRDLHLIVSFYFHSFCASVHFFTCFSGCYVSAFILWKMDHQILVCFQKYPLPLRSRLKLLYGLNIYDIATGRITRSHQCPALVCLVLFCLLLRTSSVFRLMCFRF